MSSAHGLRTSVHTSLRDLQALWPEWYALYQRVRPPNPFAHPIWSLTWLEHFAPTVPYVVTVRDERGDLVGVAPFYWHDLRHAGLTIPSLVLAGTRLTPACWSGGTELPQLLMVNGVGADAGMDPRRAILTAMGRVVGRSPDWRILNCRLAPDQTDLEPAWITTVRCRLNRQYSQPYAFVVLALPRDPDEWQQQLRPNVKEDIRKARIRPRKHGLVWEVATVRTPGEIATAVDEVIALHRRRAAQNATAQRINYVPDADTARFLRAVAVRLAHEDAIAVHLVRCQQGAETATVAGSIVLETEHSIFLSVSGMDPRFGRYKFPTTLLVEIIRDAIRRGKTTANLSAGPNRAKTRWITDPARELQEARSILVFRAGDPRALAAWAYLHFRDAMRARADRACSIMSPVRVGPPRCPLSRPNMNHP